MSYLKALADRPSPEREMIPRALLWAMLALALSALLITAAVGAMVLAHGERLTPKLDQKARAKARIEDFAANGVHPGPPNAFGHFGTSQPPLAAALANRWSRQTV